MSTRRSIAAHMAAAAFAAGAAHVASAQTATPSSAPTQNAAQTAMQNSITVETTSYREWSPPAPFTVEMILGMGALYLGLCVLASRKFGVTKGSAACGFMAGAVALYGMAHWQQIDQTRETLPTETLIVVDASPSQSFNDRAKQTAEHAAALEAKLKSSIPGIKVHTIKVSGEKDGMAADGTRIVTGIDDALSNIPAKLLGGVFILSDGQVHDKLPENFGTGVPVHTLISGKDSEYDRRVELVELAPSGLVGKKQDIKFRITDDGNVPGGRASVKVSILQDGQVAATPTVTPGEVATASITVSHAGANVLEIKTDAVRGEVTDDNNRAFATITGNHEKLNALIWSGSANPNTRLLRNRLKADPDVNLIHLNVSRLPDQNDDTPREEMNLLPAPMNEIFGDTIGKFNLIILDKPSYFHMMPAVYQEHIVKYVNNGGALLVISGPELAGPRNLTTGPLGAILPSEPTGNLTERSFLPRISERGQRHPVTRGLPGGNKPENPAAQTVQQPAWGPFYRMTDVKPPSGSSETVMEGPDKKPLLILKRQEKGRVAMLNTDSLWRWEKSFDAKGPQGPLLLQTAHWLMKKPELDEESLRLRQEGRELIIEQQTMGDKPTSVTLRPPTGKDMQLTPEKSEPGLWRVRVPIKAYGPYSVEQKGAFPRQAYINIGPENQQEYIRTISTTDILKPLSERTRASTMRMGGAGSTIDLPVYAVKPDDIEKGYSANGMGVRMTNEGRLTQNDRNPVVPPWMLAAAIFVLMSAAYIQQAGWKNALRLPFARSKSNDNPAP